MITVSLELIADISSREKWSKCSWEINIKSAFLEFLGSFQGSKYIVLEPSKRKLSCPSQCRFSNILFSSFSVWAKIGPAKKIAVPSVINKRFFFIPLFFYQTLKLDIGMLNVKSFFQEPVDFLQKFVGRAYLAVFDHYLSG